MALVLPCSHTFHVHCLRPWLAAHDTCPCCRAHVEVLDPGAAARQLREEAEAAAELCARRGPTRSGADRVLALCERLEVCTPHCGACVRAGRRAVLAVEAPRAPDMSGTCPCTLPILREGANQSSSSAVCRCRARSAAAAATPHSATTPTPRARSRCSRWRTCAPRSWAGGRRSSSTPPLQPSAPLRRTDKKRSASSRSRRSQAATGGAVAAPPRVQGLLALRPPRARGGTPARAGGWGCGCRCAPCWWPGLTEIYLCNYVCSGHETVMRPHRRGQGWAASTPPSSSAQPSSSTGHPWAGGRRHPWAPPASATRWWRCPPLPRGWAAAAVSHSCAWIGSPCLRQCGHGASIRQPYGAGGGGGGRLLVCGGSATFSTRRSHLPAVPRVSLKRLLD
jgi:hypothetical protein